MADGAHCDRNDLECDDAGDESKRYFYLKNALSGNLVLDVQGFGRLPGTPVILWEKKPYNPSSPEFVYNQLWYEDSASHTIRSAMNDYCLDFCGIVQFN